MAGRLGLPFSFLGHHQGDDYLLRAVDQPGAEFRLEFFSRRRSRGDDQVEGFPRVLPIRLGGVIFSRAACLVPLHLQLSLLERGNFARFAIPILPFVLLALYRWLPKDRRVLWALAIIVPELAAGSALGLANVIQAVHKGVR